MTAPLETAKPEPCWFCGHPAQSHCNCGRAYCSRHGLPANCMVCALAYGLYEKVDQLEPVSDLIILSLSAEAGDAYIVIPPGLQEATPLPLAKVEQVVGTLIQMLQSADAPVRHRAAVALANTFVSWPTLNPSKLASHGYGTSLLAGDHVRRWLLGVLQNARGLTSEQTAVGVLDKLRVADFRDLYPSIQNKLEWLTCASLGTRVYEVFTALAEFYPTPSYAANERSELCVYEQYMDRNRGAGAVMERMYGPRLRFNPQLAKMLKRGVWHASYKLFTEWYPGEDEPY